MTRHGKAEDSLDDTLVRAMKVALPDSAANDDGGSEPATAPAWDPLEVWRRCVRDVRDLRNNGQDDTPSG